MITIVRKILCFSVEPEAQRKLTRHGSVEIYDGEFSLKRKETTILDAKLLINLMHLC